MKMSIFSKLAKASLSMESVKDSNFVTIRHTIGFLDYGNILEQYINIKQNLLYKTETAGLRRKRLLKMDRT
jgi:hypothetical protein